MDERGTETHTTPPERSRSRGVLWAFIAVVLAFGAGFGWQFYEATMLRHELADTRQELRVERLRVRLGQAAIAAQAGDYETARQGMSEFFTRLDEIQSELPDHVARVGDELLAARDDIITGLSRSNPEYADVLYRMLDQFRAAVPAEMRGEEIEPPTRPRPEPVDSEADTLAPDTVGGQG